MKRRVVSKVISLLLVVVMVFGLAITVTASDGDMYAATQGVTDEEKNITRELINYVAITSSMQQLNDTQQVVVGIGDGYKNLKGGILTYKNNNTNELYQIECRDKIDDALYFAVDYKGKSEGIYQLVGLEYVIDGRKVSVSLRDAGLDASWGVGVDYTACPDEVIPVDNENEKAIEEMADVTFEVTTDEGKTATASSIAKALEEASDDLSIESNGVVKTQSTFESAKEDVEVVSDTGLTKANNAVKNTGAGNVVIVLDPGHGGNESGACYGSLKEKDVNLRVATYCKSALEQYGGVSVYMTRYDDRDVGLAERTDIARNYGANAFVSIHMNSGGASGVEVWYPNGNYRPDISDVGYKLSGKILDNIASLGLFNRGLKMRNSETGATYPDGSIMDYYSVIHNSKTRGFPGIIVEHAFMDGDYGRLCDDNFLRQLGQADANGIAQYYGLGPAEDLSQYIGAFDANFYRFFNQDLWSFNDQQCFNHWINYGVWEGRQSSPVFKMTDYTEANHDLAAAYGFDWRAYARHFNQYGMQEGRKSLKSFSVKSYKNRYRDLRNAYGSDLRSYYLHYVTNGFSEGRETIGYDNTLVGGGVNSVWIFNFADAYDYDYYTSHNPDLVSVFGCDDTAILNHFINYGIREGRQAKADFSVVGYKNRNLDLRRAYGNDLFSYVAHYISYGKKEGRDGSYTDRITDGEHYFFGADFSPVYDFNYYQACNPDVRAAFGNDDVATFIHFLTCGMKEGRRASASFNLEVYANKNPDLFAAYFFNLTEYYLHYIKYGRAEGRIAS